MSKYKNIKTTVNGIKFDSKKEAHRYNCLVMLEKAGHISKLELQPRFELIHTVRWNGKTLSKRSYVADFMYIENGKTIVEDVKGFLTAVYKLKRQLFLAKYPQYVFRET